MIMTKNEALKMALNALEPQEFWAEWYYEGHVIPKAIEAINQALMQPNKEWVGLSNEDIDELIPRTDLSGDYGYQDMYAVARIVEYRLRMQNHG